ncbi:hypothetical protein HT031_005687 [Scenedesmus sp. PABB004]|nr:hypothetical protein HT031_005687 [Scenedesmus sp. PABB004]
MATKPTSTAAGPTAPSAAEERAAPLTRTAALACCAGAASAPASRRPALAPPAAAFARRAQSAEPTCFDGIKNGDETDVDCGGSSCLPCLTIHAACKIDSDCGSDYCKGGSCGEPHPTCSDGIKNGLETGVDCGGSACPACSIGTTCLVPTDCDTGNCVQGTCSGAWPTCSDGIKNQDETGTDCGGVSCRPCPLQQPCALDGDCSSGNCVNSVCSTVAPSCSNTTCGGTCPACPAGSKCTAATDCASTNCVSGVCATKEPTCTDGVKNGDETAVDCGGSSCALCGDNKSCKADGDCASFFCNPATSTCTTPAQKPSPSPSPSSPSPSSPSPVPRPSPSPSPANDICDPTNNPCAAVVGSDGACSNTAGGGFSCGCTRGLTWSAAQRKCIEKDDCATAGGGNPCANVANSNGTCHDVAAPGSGYMCDCANGFGWDAATTKCTAHMWRHSHWFSWYDVPPRLLNQEHLASNLHGIILHLHNRLHAEAAPAYPE